MKKLTLLFLLVTAVTKVIAQESLTIGILNDKETRESELLQKLKNDIIGVVGQSTDIKFNEVLYNNFDPKMAKKNYNALLANSDIIISFGVVNTVMLYEENNYAKPTIVVGAINKDFISIPKDQNTSQTNNLNYLITPFSYKEDLDVFASVFPFQKIGVVLDQYVLDMLPVKEQFDNYFKDKTSSYKFIPLDHGMNYDAMFLDVDAVYLIGNESINDAEFEELISSINERKLPSFSAYGMKDLEEGVLMTNQPAINFDQFFRRIALNIESINNGTNAAELPLIIDNRKGLSINMATAETISFHIKNSMLATVNLIEGTSSVDPQFAYSLKEIMDQVVVENLTLNVERQNISLSEQDVKSSKSQYYPDLTANVNSYYIDPKVAEISNGQNPELSTGGNLTLNQVIYSEQATANVSIQKSLLDAEKENFNASELDIILNSSIAYFNTLILKTNVSIQNKNLQLTRQNLTIADQNLEFGDGAKSDVLRFKSQLAQNTQSMIEARNSLRQAYNQINQLLNNPISNKVSIEDSIITVDKFRNDSYDFLVETLDHPNQRSLLIGFLIEESFRNSPELKNIEYNRDAIDRSYKLNSYGRFIPTLSLQGHYNYAFSNSGVGSEIPIGVPTSPDGTYNVGLNLTLPIFQQNQRNINRQTSIIQQDQLNIQRSNIELSFEQNMNDIVLDLINEIANIEISAVNLSFSQESLDLSQNEYRNGAIPVIQLLDAQNNYLQAYLTNATAKYNYFLVLMQLQRALGTFFLMETDAVNQDFIDRAGQYILNNN